MLNWFKDKFSRRPWMQMSFGELIDKRAILRVKLNRLSNKTDLRMISKQIKFIDDGLRPYVCRHLTAELQEHLEDLMDTLEKNHYLQWDWEDAVLAASDVAEGVKAAKNSRLLNQVRAKIKREIDLMFNEKFLEIKDYAKPKDL